MKDAEFHAYLERQGYQDIVYGGDGQYAAINRLLFHYSLILGTVGDYETYDNRFCYTADPAPVQDALVEWHSRDFAGEPAGWQRHPKTGRRRVNGDPGQESIDW